MIVCESSIYKSLKRKTGPSKKWHALQYFLLHYPPLVLVSHHPPQPASQPFTLEGTGVCTFMAIQERMVPCTVSVPCVVFSGRYHEDSCGFSCVTRTCHYRNTDGFPANPPTKESINSKSAVAPGPIALCVIALCSTFQEPPMNHRERTFFSA